MNAEQATSKIFQTASEISLAANQLFKSIEKMHAAKEPDLTPDVIAAEIKAHRAEQRSLITQA